MALKGFLDGHAKCHVVLGLVVGRRQLGQQLEDLRDLVLRDDDDAVDGVVDGEVAGRHEHAVDGQRHLSGPGRAAAA